MQTHAPHNMGNGEGAARCILWLPRGHDAPIDLVRGLEQRHVRIRQVHDAPAVMVELATRAGRSSCVLVIVEPDALRSADALRAAVGRYHKHVPIWRYDHDKSPALQRWAKLAQTAPTAPKPRDVPPVDEDEPSDEPLLSEQELAMLLGEMPDESERAEP